MQATFEMSQELVTELSPQERRSQTRHASPEQASAREPQPAPREAQPAPKELENEEKSKKSPTKESLADNTRNNSRTRNRSNSPEKVLQNVTNFTKPTVQKVTNSAKYSSKLTQSAVREHKPHVFEKSHSTRSKEGIVTDSRAQSSTHYLERTGTLTSLDCSELAASKKKFQKVLKVFQHNKRQAIHNSISLGLRDVDEILKRMAKASPRLQALSGKVNTIIVDIREMRKNFSISTEAYAKKRDELVMGLRTSMKSYVESMLLKYSQQQQSMENKNAAMMEDVVSVSEGILTKYKADILKAKNTKRATGLDALLKGIKV